MTFSELRLGEIFLLIEVTEEQTGAVLPCLAPREPASVDNLDLAIPVFQRISPHYAQEIEPGTAPDRKMKKRKISPLQPVIKLRMPITD